MNPPDPRNIPLLRSVHGEPYPLSEHSHRGTEQLLTRVRKLRERLALSIAEAANAEALAWQMAQKDRYHEDPKVRSLVAHMNTIIGDYQRRLREDLAGACRRTVDLETTLRLGFDGFWMTSDPERMRRISDEAIQMEVEEELKKANFEETRRAGAHVGEK